MNKENPKAVVLLSGGLDSATTLFVARSQGFALHAISFRYGQRHAAELGCAAQIAHAAGVVQHQLLEVNLSALGGSALTGASAVPKHRTDAEIGHGIPSTYVPARNTVFLSLGLAWAEVLGASDIFIGVNALDYSGYPDCRPEFIAAFERLANLATKAGVEGTARFRIHTPLIAMSKAQIIRTGLALGVDFSLTSSCYDPQPDGRPCGACDSCALRHKGFAELGLTDPLEK
jgi:7-cyano-7-deazaguanine synthase